MFDVYCPTHRAVVLLGPRCIEELVTTEDGVEVHWRCRCGTRGVLGTRRPAVIDRRPRPIAA